MRKKKLYLSEFIARNKNNEDCKVKIFHNGNSYNYNDFNHLKAYYEYYKKDEEIEHWTYNEYFGFIIVIK